MECSLCFETYNDEERKPRNLDCGHTFCEDCIYHTFTMSRISCPTCRTITYKVPSALQINYIAAEIARHAREERKKKSFCDVHKVEPIRFYCNSCDVNMCVECIVSHSGHYFVRQDESVEVMKKKANVMREEVDSIIQKLYTQKTDLIYQMDRLAEREQRDLEFIDAEFDEILQALNNRRRMMKENYKRLISHEAKKLENELYNHDHKSELIEQEKQKLHYTLSQLHTMKDCDVREGNYQAIMHEHLESIENMRKFMLSPINELPAPPHISLNKESFLESIESLGLVESLDYRNFQTKNPMICFFGEKNKVMTFDIQTNVWELRTCESRFEFNYYAASVTLSDGNALITGGGSSNTVYLYKHPRLLLKAPMHNIRKEHAAVSLNGFVYAMGGYDGVNSCFLSACERYDIAKDEWKCISPMHIARCAFSATSVNNHYIFIFGGYDGVQRLASIEKYEPDRDIWTVLDVSLRFPLSNCACFSPKWNQILVLGGGFSNGFSFQVECLDISRSSWKSFSKMSEGRDLRNKIAYYENQAYCIGGYNSKAEKLDLNTEEWIQLPNYIINDNLDAWSSALIYSLEPIQDNKNNKIPF